MKRRRAPDWHMPDADVYIYSFRSCLCLCFSLLWLMKASSSPVRTEVCSRGGRVLATFHLSCWSFAISVVAPNYLSG